MTLKNEKRLLQIVIALGCLVPLLAGTTGGLRGTAFLDEHTGLDLDNHFRYLSGLLLGIGVGFLTAIPKIETQTMRIRLLTTMVVIGGFFRLLGDVTSGLPGTPMQIALGIELIAVPAICLWQHSLARRWKSLPLSSGEGNAA